MLLSNNFATVYPSGQVVVGGASPLYSITFQGALAIQNYLPAGGKPKALTADYLNPTSTSSGVFGGQVLALELNADFSGLTDPISGAIIVPGGFGDLVLSNTGTSLDGQTVSYILALANLALGGGALPLDYTIPSLNDLISFLNQGFDNCYPSGWVQDHLTPTPPTSGGGGPSLS